MSKLIQQKIYIKFLIKIKYNVSKFYGSRETFKYFSNEPHSMLLDILNNKNLVGTNKLFQFERSDKLSTWEIISR